MQMSDVHPLDLMQSVTKILGLAAAEARKLGIDPDKYMDHMEDFRKLAVRKTEMPSGRVGAGQYRLPATNRPIGRVVGETVEMLGLTQAQAARDMGVNEASLSTWLRDDVTPTGINSRKIKRWLQRVRPEVFDDDDDADAAEAAEEPGTDPKDVLRLRVIEYRANHNVTNAELAKAIGVRPHVIEKIVAESPKTKPGADFMRKVTQWLDKNE